MKKKVSLAAYLAGVTTLAVSLPAMAERQNDFVVPSDGFATSLESQAIPTRKDDEREV